MNKLKNLAGVIWYGTILTGLVASAFIVAIPMGIAMVFVLVLFAFKK